MYKQSPTQVALATLSRASFSRAVGVTPLQSVGAFSLQSAGFMLAHESYWGVKPELVETARTVQTIWFLSKSVIDLNDTLMSEIRNMNQVVQSVDSVRHHNAPLEKESATVIAKLTGFSAEQQEHEQAIAELSSIAVLTAAITAGISGKFRKDLKVKISDRIDRHHEATLELVRNLEELRIEFDYPKTAHAARKQACMKMLDRVEQLIKFFETFISKHDSQHTPECFYNRLTGHFSTLGLIRSKLQRWRDNPSQRLGQKFAEAVEEVGEICTDLFVVKDEAFTIARKLGMRFYTRVGLVALECETSA